MWNGFFQFAGHSFFWYVSETPCSLTLDCARVCELEYIDSVVLFQLTELLIVYHKRNKRSLIILSTQVLKTAVAVFLKFFLSPAHWPPPPLNEFESNLESNFFQHTSILCIKDTLSCKRPKSPCIIVNILQDLGMCLKYLFNRQVINDSNYRSRMGILRATPTPIRKYNISWH